MQTREQRFARAALYRVEQVVERRDPTFANLYGGLSHKIPVLILSSGLAQALSFMYARGPVQAKGTKPSVPGATSAHHQLLMDLAWVLAVAEGEFPADPARTLPLPAPDALLRKVQEASLTDYMRMTRLTVQALVWFKRYAQSVLEVEPGDDDTPDPGGVR